MLMSSLFLAGSFGVLWWARKQEARGQAVALAADIPLSQLAEDAGSVARELGPGSFRQEVKIRGKVTCDAPLVAELSHTPCVSYRFSVTREFEEVLWERDAQGNSVQRSHRKSEVVASHEASVPFWLDDGTGKIWVDPAEAKIERIPSHSGFQPNTVGSVRMGVGSFVLDLAPVGGTLGYRYSEECLPLDREVTVVAEAGDAGGQLALRRPETGAPFIITQKSAKELAKSNRFLVSVLKGTSAGLALLSILIFLIGVIR